MKLKLHIITGVAAVGLLSPTMLVAETNDVSMNEDGSNNASMNQSDRLNNVVKASDVIGLEIQNYQNEKLGKVSDLALDVSSGRMVLVVVASGGFMGLRPTLIAVPPGALHHDISRHMLHLDANKKKFLAGTKFNSLHLNGATQATGLNEVYGNYGDQPYAAAGHENDDVAVALNTFGTIYNDTARRMDDNSGVSRVRNYADTNNTSTTSTSAVIANRDSTSGGKGQARLGYVQMASKLMGMAVRDLQDDKIGGVKNFAVDVAAGRIVAVIVASGGYLGIGDELSAIPPTLLQFSENHKDLVMDTSKELLANSPHFKNSQWPDFDQTNYIGGVYRAYNLEPYFTTSHVSEADNSRRNVSERDDRTLTPIDQGNNQSDINTTAQIRKEIIAEDGMSTNAKNVKIITVDGQVTLRGPVNTAEEKRRIGDIANRIANTGNVDNQLEVQLTTSSN